MLNESEKLNEIIRLGTELVMVQDVDILLEKILHKARRIVNADAGTIYVREGDHLKFSHAQNDTLSKNLPPGYKLIYSVFKSKISTNFISGYVAATGEILNIPDVYQISGTPYGFDSNCDKISNYKTTSMLTVPLKTSRGDILGVLQIINALDDKGRVVPFDKNDEPFILHYASIAGMILQRAQMTRILLLRMISMAEQRDPKETASHVNRVAAYSVELYEHWAHRKHLPEEQIERNRDILRMAAMLHDVGKVAISDLILKKPSHFTEDEYVLMKNHTWLGARLFKEKQSDLDDVASSVALTHHENWDGSGYPGYVDVDTGTPISPSPSGGAVGRKGEEIPIFGRIVALADVFDALSSKRVYKNAWSEQDVLDEIRRESGKKFDPDIVEVFFESLDLLRSIAKRYPDAD
jgi:HD-GYP domain-containing protein (c-di-GMP phosphodiesterase class II)